MPTRIEWATEVWNPITGCSPISEGCQNCYAKRMAQRLKGRFGYPEDDPFKVTFHPDRLYQPLHWHKSKRIFVVSMGDLFHGNVTIEQIASILGVMSFCQQHTFMVLTKRPARMASFFNKIHNADYNSNFNWWLNEACLVLPDEVTRGIRLRPKPDKFPLPNVYLGVTVESNKYLWRVEELIKTPAAKRFVSIEPMLGPIDFSIPGKVGGYLWDINWVIAGGESGSGARPMQINWVRSVAKQCIDTAVRFFFKQWGDYNRKAQGLQFITDPNNTGRLLDGKQWNETP